jgi:hypothetical protein
MWKKRAIVLGFLIYFICFWFVFSGIFNLTFLAFCLFSVFFSFSPYSILKENILNVMLSAYFHLWQKT